MSVRDLAQAEPADLADLLASLTSQQWEAPSLCERWRVRDVVAHVVSYDGLGAAGLARRLGGGRLLLDRVNAAGVAEHRDRDPQELVALLRQHAVPSGLPAGFGGRIALVDTLVHTQDVRRPLGLPRRVPAERLRAALPFALLAPPIRALGHVRGAVLLAMAGRRGVAQERSGPGADRLARRLG